MALRGGPRIIGADPDDYALLTPAKVKTYLGVYHNEEDPDITSMILAATEILEGYCNRVFEDRQLRQDFDAWEAVFQLPLGPAYQVTSIKYWPAGAGALATLPAASYYLDTTTDRITMLADPLPDLLTDGRPDLVQIVWKAGESDTSPIHPVPETARVAARQMVVEMHQHRGVMIEPSQFSMVARMLMKRAASDLGGKRKARVIKQ